MAGTAYHFDVIHGYFAVRILSERLVERFLGSNHIQAASASL
jgi:hypothetical protein